MNDFVGDLFDPVNDSSSVEQTDSSIENHVLPDNENDIETTIQQLESL